jgi:hypothetical protein
MSAVSLAQDILCRLRHDGATVLSEADLQAHLPGFFLSRPTGNLIADVLAKTLHFPASVEMFVNQETGETMSIQLLIARDMASYTAAHDALADAFEAKHGERAESLINVILD